MTGAQTARTGRGCSLPALTAGRGEGEWAGCPPPRADPILGSTPLAAARRETMCGRDCPTAVVSKYSMADAQVRVQWQAHAVAADASWYALKLAAAAATHQLQQLLATALQQKHQ